MKKIFILTFLVLFSYAKELTLKIAQEEPSSENLGIYQEVVIPKNIRLTDDALKKDFLNNQVYANKYLNKYFDKNETVKIQFELLKLLANKYKAKVLENHSAEIAEDVVKSYYNANLDKFKRDNRYSFYILFLEDKKFIDLKQKYSSSNLEETLKNYKNEKFSDITYSALPEVYKLALKNKKLNSLSDEIRLGDTSVALILIDFKPEGVLSYDETKEGIRNYLTSKKIKEILDKELK